MKILDLINFLKVNVPYVYYPNKFPTSSQDDCAVVRLTGGSQASKEITRPAFQVIVRSKHPSTAELKAWEIFDFLNQKSNFNVGSTRVIFCASSNSSPIFIGTDENDRHMYSVNFNMVAEVL